MSTGQRHGCNKILVLDRNLNQEVLESVLGWNLDAFCVLGFGLELEFILCFVFWVLGRNLNSFCVLGFGLELEFVLCFVFWVLGRNLNSKN